MRVLVFSFFLTYCGFLILLIAGWYRNRRLSAISSKEVEVEELISIIIPVRNEEDTIGHLLNDLLDQQHQHIEVLVVDDHSEDHTKAIVGQYAEKDNRIRLYASGGVGKKEALTAGIQKSTGNIIMTTDGDCRASVNWVRGMNRYFREPRVKMVIGAVKMEGNSFFERLQSIEFASLIGTAAATAGWGVPTLCNGANLAFRRGVFIEVGGYQGNFHIPSGDDEFLMRKVLEKDRASVRFAADGETVVTTLPNRDIKHFLHQRVRWAGKWKSTKSIITKLLAMFIFFFQCTFILLPILMLRHRFDLEYGTVLLSLKIGLEAIFLVLICRFLKLSWSWSAFVSLQLLYPLYVAVIGLCSNFRSFEWKGRKLKSLTVSNN